jgi:hypothetical protein
LELEDYPNSGAAFSSLAGALLMTGQQSLVIENYKKVLELDPQSTGAIEMLRKLGAS